MDEIRIGLFGLGHRGLHLLQLIQRIEGYRITAIGDMFPALHEPGLLALDNRDGVAAYADYKDLLADPNVDAVALVVRCKEQGAMAAQALEAGKHVNSEVPAAYTMEDCWRIVVAAERSGLVYLLGEQYRYSGIIEAWHDLVQQGRLGRVTFCEGEYIGYKGRLRYHQDWQTAEFVEPEDVEENSHARPTWRHLMDPIYYLPHSLGPIFKVLEDRVVHVTAMSTRVPSYSHPELSRADIQVALMKTEKDAILRMVCGYTQPTPSEKEHLTYRIMGTRGSVESARTRGERPKLWFADSQMHAMADVDWRFERTDAPPDASMSGHRNMDYYVQTAFRDAVLGARPLEFDVYKAIDTAAPAILAVESIRQRSASMDVPDFRPSEARPSGQLPESV